MKAKVLSSAFMIAMLSAVCVWAQMGPLPLVNNTTPASAAPGGKAFVLTVHGGPFTSGAVLKWNGSPRQTGLVSETVLKARIDAEDVAKAGTAALTVSNPGSGTSNVLYFPIRPPAATVALSVDPNVTATGAVVAGDFNNDGKLDLAIGQTKNGTGTVQVYLGKGNGQFQPPISTTISGVYEMLAGDFNNDGKLDLIIGYSGADILFGKGDGTFDPPIHFESDGFSSYPDAVGDFNGDGKLDVIVGNMSIGTPDMGIYLNTDNKGSFTPVQSLAEYPAGVAVGDFNGDGILDLAVPGNGIDVYLGTGTGTFQAPINYPTSHGPEHDAVAVDINGDGKLDVVTNGVSVYLGHGDGTFTASGGYSLGLVDKIGIVAGDFNGDGKLDVAVPTAQAGGGLPQTLNLLLGNGNGNFQVPIQVAASSSSDQYLGLGLGDFTGDGGLDFAVTGSSTTLLVQGVLTATPNNLDFGDQGVGTTSAPQIVTLTNIGNASLSINRIRIGGLNSQEFGQANNCGTSIPPHGSCQVQVTFSPGSPGEGSATLIISYNGVGTPQTVGLRGNGVIWSASLTPPKINFPLQLVGTQSPPQTATLTNTGSDNLTLSGISTSGPFTQTNNCPPILGTNQSCQILVSYKPTGPNQQNGILSVSDNAPDSPQTITLTGTGTVVHLSLTSINFGDQKVGTGSSPVPVKLTNTGSITLNISSITISGNNPGDFAQVNNCGNSVPPRSACTIKVTFDPQTTGSRSAILNINDDGGGSPQTVALAGTGT